MMAEVHSEPLAYPVPAFCKAVGISVRTFYGLLERGEGPAIVKIGRRTVIRREAADQWLKDRETPA